MRQRGISVGAPRVPAGHAASAQRHSSSRATIEVRLRRLVFVAAETGGAPYAITGSAAAYFPSHSRCTFGEISLGLISLRPPQNTFV